MDEACSTYEGEEGCIQDLGGRKSDGKRTLVRPRRRWEDNIKMDLQDVGGEAWTGLIWLRIRQVVGDCECGNEPSGSIKCGEFLD
jgi:hypothetical protein